MTLTAIFLAIIAICPVTAPEPAYVARHHAAAYLSPGVSTGTMLFSQGNCLAVRWSSGSRFTHVGMAIRSEDGKISVIDAMNGVGVREQPFRDYLAEIGDAELHVCPPAEPLTPAQASRFTGLLRSELGKPYTVRQYVTGSRTSGTHCAELAIKACDAAGILTAENPARVSPGSLHTGAIKTGVFTCYATIRMFDMPTETTDDQAPCGWLGRTWTATKSCTVAGYRKCTGWLFCK